MAYLTYTERGKGRGKEGVSKGHKKRGGQWMMLLAGVCVLM
jgi:hypothetical protein